MSDSEAVRVEPCAAKTIEPWRQMLIDTMLSVDRQEPDNGYLKRDAELLVEGGLGHLDTWIVIETFARFEEQLLARHRRDGMLAAAELADKVEKGLLALTMETGVTDARVAAHLAAESIASAIRSAALGERA